jgi:hypothetical protein
VLQPALDGQEERAMPEPEIVGPPAPTETPQSPEAQLAEARALLEAALARLTSQPQPYGGELHAAIARFLAPAASPP